MSKKRKSEAGAVVIFFQTQPLDVARSILDICNETVAARMPKVDKATKAVQKVEKKRLQPLPKKLSIS